MRAGGRAQLEAGLAALQQQPGQLAGRQQPVLRAGAGQVAAAEAVDVRQARRHLDHAHLLPVQRDDLRQGQDQRRRGEQARGLGALLSFCEIRHAGDLAARGDAQQDDAAMRVGEGRQGLGQLVRRGAGGTVGNALIRFRQEQCFDIRSQPTGFLDEHFSVAPPE